MLVSRSVHYDSHHGYSTRRQPVVEKTNRRLVQSYENGVRGLCRESEKNYMDHKR